MYKDATQTPLHYFQSNEAGIEANALEWDLSPETKTAVQKAETDVDKFISSIEMSLLDVPEVNSKLLKEKKLSPDGFLQMSFQVRNTYFYLV